MSVGQSVGFRPNEINTILRVVEAHALTAEEGMAKMSELFKETGRELYMGAGDREHD